MELVLASTSVYRKALLERFGLPFRCQAPPIDERTVQRPEWSPAQVASELARAKARSVAALFPQATVIGSDQVCCCDGQILHKPVTAARAQVQLRSLAGRAHQLLTAVTVCCNDTVESHLDTTTLLMRPLTDAEIERYVAADQPLDCAGSYKIEARGISLFAAIESADQTAITGLPLLAVCQLLRDCGWNLP